MLLKIEMYNPETGEVPAIQLHNVGFYKAIAGKEYIDITSPFTRLYLITKGTGSLTIGNKTIYLEEGYIYLIPSYTICTYKFNPDMWQYYIHFTTQLSGELNVFDFYSHHNQARAQTFDLYMMQRLLSLHPKSKLTTDDPNIYQKKDWMMGKVGYSSVSHFMETRGIIEQLLSRFLAEERASYHKQRLAQYNLKQIFIYIENNLHTDISIHYLAKMACLSKDHFSRVFKSVTGFPPREYIIRKRVEKAQRLLLTTHYPQNRIIDETGFKSLTYFSKVFKKYATISPGKYRKKS